MNPLLQRWLNRDGFKYAIVIIIATALYFAYSKGEISLLKLVLLTLFVSMTALSFLALLQILSNDHLGVYRSSPTIDGSISGWRFSNSLTHLLITCLFAVATILLSVEKPSLVSKATNSSGGKDTTAKVSPKATETLKQVSIDTTQKSKTTSDSTTEKK